MAAAQRSVVWIDSAGATTQTILASDPDAGTIQSTLQGHSNADVLNWWEGPPNPNTTPTTTAATYFTVSDTARLLFLDSAGSLTTVNLPAPKASIFAADTVTVDPSAIADVIAAVIAKGRSAGGNPIVSFVAGNLSRRRVFA